MRRAALPGVATAVLAVSLAACGGARHDARVSGEVKLCGAPAPAPDKCFTEPVRIFVTGRNGHVVARSHPSNGRFSFDLAPDAYTVSAEARGHAVGSVSIRAVAGRTTDANITNDNVA